MMAEQNMNKDGQASIEFALVLTLMIGFIFFYFQLCLVFAWGNYIHYATFMSARAYQAAGFNQEDQVARAKNVLIRAVKKGIAFPGRDRLPVLARGFGGDDLPGIAIDSPKNFDAKTRNLSWLEGVRYTFRSRLFLVPMAGSSGDGGKTPSVNEITLTSESWLGREPSYDECLGYLKKNFKTAFIDNGC